MAFSFATKHAPGDLAKQLQIRHLPQLCGKASTLDAVQAMAMAMGR